MFLEKLKALFGFGKSTTETKPDTAAEYREGVVKYFNKKKGFGFIRPNDDSKDVFVHISDLKINIKKGNKVRFKVEKEPKGLRAVDIERI